MERSYHLIFFLVLFSVGKSKLSEQENDDVTATENGNECYFDEVEFLVPINCNASAEDGRSVPHNTNCTFRQVSDITLDLSTQLRTVKHLVCHDGHWSGTDFSVGHGLNRQKRFIGLLIGLGVLAVGGVFCIIFCGSDSPPPKYPPEFETCRPGEVHDEYKVAAGQSVVVRWRNIPKATDKNGDNPKVELIKGTNGGSYKGKTTGMDYSIVYKATDNDELTITCEFRFKVYESVCKPPLWIDNGKHRCTDYRVGKQCQYECNVGYELIGNSIIKCENVQSPRWSPAPTCKIKKCPIPPQLANGNVTCEAYVYQKSCTLSCNTGYGLHGPGFMQCQSDKTWKNAGQAKCIDNTPPTLICNTPQKFNADRNASSTSVTWKEPIITDNTDLTPTLVKISGPSMGDIITGSENVIYKGIDAEGNESPECKIELRVQEITCPHPSRELPNRYLQYECDGSKFIYGVSCKLSCLVNLPLNGTDMITCEKGDGKEPIGVWDWGDGTQPYCEDISCPDLDPPINGALVYDTVKAREVYTMVCNKEYDIPPLGNHFNGMFFCLDKTGWQPINEVPDCIRAISPRGLHLPSTLYYYDGDCETPESQAEIQKNFLDIVHTKIQPLLNDICPSTDDCDTENIRIVCGDIQKDDKSKRRKREAKGGGVLAIHFNIVMNVTVAHGSPFDIDKYDAITTEMSSQMQTLLVNGSLDLDKFVTRNDSLETPQYADIACAPGFIVDGMDCKACPPGHFLNEAAGNGTSGECQKCPIGQYSAGNGSIACGQCPDGFSTKMNGSKSLDNCTEICGPGTMSPDGMKPCSVCMFGEYQDDVGQTSCTQCPRGTTTQYTNSSSNQDCQSFDIVVEATSAPIVIGNMSTSMNNLTLMLWTKRVDEQELSTRVELQSDDEEILTVDITHDIHVQIPKKLNEVVAQSSSKTWVHLAVVWDTILSSVFIYVNGNMKHTAPMTSSNPLVSNGELKISSNGQSGLKLTGFHLMDRSLDATEIATYLSACHLTNADDIIDLEDIRRANIGETLISSSNCSVVDNCQPDPCNGHLCIDKQGTFSCLCYSGWSGDTCLVPPDHCIDNECENGATCQNGNSSYTCDCMPGYSGPMCEIPPVNGEWSEWEITSECTKDCGTGSLNRTRRCDSPPPGPYGANCIGNATETISCNTEVCQVCDELPIKNGTRKTCDVDTKTRMQTCEVSCEDGKAMQPSRKDNPEYKCGPETNYEWNSVNTLPYCVEQSPPTKLSIDTSVEYNSTIRDEDEPDIIASIKNNFQKTSCADKCNVSVIRSGNTFTVTYSVDLSDIKELNVEEYAQNGTVSDSLRHFVESMKDLEMTAQHIQNNTSDMFDVEVDGEVYAVDADSLTTAGVVTCPEGQIAQEGVCVKCPEGTHSTRGYCTFCEIGTYQPFMGESTCMQCPYPLTTRSIGSTDISDCIDMTIKKSGPAYPIKTSNTALVLALTLSFSALVVASLAFGIVWYKKYRSKTKVSDSVPDMSGRRQANGSNMTTPMQYLNKKDSHPDFYIDFNRTELNTSDVVNVEMNHPPKTTNPPPGYTVN